MTALSHLKVVDLSRILAGPWASQVLADLGATVIKIEHPHGGDDTRRWGPPYLAGADGEPPGPSAYFLAANRNKQSLTLDIATADGQAIVRDLVRDADVLIENFKVDGLARYGLDHASLSAVNPRLIYCSITGFGQDGPYAARPGYDLLLQAMGGLMSITGAPGAPQKVGVAVVDLMTGLYAATGILAALASRDRTGVGQHIDLALLDVAVAGLANQGMNYLVSGISPTALGNAHPSIVPYQDFPTADGAIVVAVGNDAQFRQFCAVVGRPELGHDPLYATNADRVANRMQLLPLIRTALALRSTAEWVAALEAAKVPCGPINTIADLFDDPQVAARMLRRSIDHPVTGAVPSLASPLRLSGTPVEYRRAPPLLGEDTDAVLRGMLGYSAARIADLRARRVI